jgi:hypothetical protein
MELPEFLQKLGALIQETEGSSDTNVCACRNVLVIFKAAICLGPRSLLDFNTLLTEMSETNQYETRLRQLFKIDT